MAECCTSFPPEERKQTPAAAVPGGLSDGIGSGRFAVDGGANIVVATAVRHVANILSAFHTEPKLPER